MTSASHYVASESRYQRRFLIYIRGLIPRNFTELAETLPIGGGGDVFVKKLIKKKLH